MSFYDLRKAKDRARLIEDRKAEIEAIDKGEWPRDIDDYMRWGSTRQFDRVADRGQFARRMCEAEVNAVEVLNQKYGHKEVP